MSIHRAGHDLSAPSGSDGDRRGTHPAGSAAGADTREGRLGLIRHRIGRGFYDDPAVATRVARLLLSSGDLTRPRP